MSAASLPRDVAACVLACMQAKEIALAARVSRAWRAASLSRTAWQHVQLRVDTGVSLLAVPLFVRRLVRAVHCAQWPSLPHALPLVHLPAVTALHLANTGDERAFPAGAGFPRAAKDAAAANPEAEVAATPLRSLVFGKLHWLPADALRCILEHPRLRSLESLEIDCSDYLEMSALAHATHLRRLVVGNVRENESGLLWAAIQGLVHLHTCEAQWHRPPALESGVPLPPSLTHLHIWPQEGLTQLLQPLRNQLRHLRLTIQVHAAEFVAVQRPFFSLLARAPHLRYLELCGLDGDYSVHELVLPELVRTLLAGRHPLRPTAVQLTMRPRLPQIGALTLERTEDQAQAHAAAVEDQAEADSEAETTTYSAEAADSSATSNLPPHSARLVLSFFPSLPVLAQLTSLDVQQAYWTTEFAGLFSMLHLPQLRSLSMLLSEDPSPFDSDVAAAVFTWPSCEALWATIGRHTALEYLRVDLWLPFSEVGVGAALDRLPHLSRVRLCDGLQQSPDVFQEESAAALLRLPALAELELMGCHRLVTPPDRLLQPLCAAVTGGTGGTSRLRLLHIRSNRGLLADLLPLALAVHPRGVRILLDKTDLYAQAARQQRQRLDAPPPQQKKQTRRCAVM